jgi:hypothetical protein
MLDHNILRVSLVGLHQLPSPLSRHGLCVTGKVNSGDAIYLVVDRSSLATSTGRLLLLILLLTARMGSLMG